MPRLLGIETSTDVCAAALSEGGRVVGVKTLHQPRRHAEQLVPLIAELLDEAEWRPAQIDAIAVSKGPGSFTGLRIGVSSAKGLAMACDCALVGVPTLAALASQVADAHVLVALRARRDEVFCGRYRRDSGGQLVPDGKVEALSPSQALQSITDPESAWTIAGDGATLLADLLESFPAHWTLHADLRPTAESVVRIGQLLFESGQVVDVEAFEPYYLKPFVARYATRTMFDRLPF